MITASIGGSATEAIAVLMCSGDLDLDVCSRARISSALPSQLQEPRQRGGTPRSLGRGRAPARNVAPNPARSQRAARWKTRGRAPPMLHLLDFAFEAALQRSNQVRILDSCWISCRAERLHAFCTANVPTPPDAPMISTFGPARTFPRSPRPCRAGKPDVATTAPARR